MKIPFGRIDRFKRGRLGVNGVFATFGAELFALVHFNVDFYRNYIGTIIAAAVAAIAAGTTAAAVANKCCI